MGSAPSMLTQYDIEEVEEHCNYLFNQREIVCLYKRFCQLDRDAKGFVSADEFLSVPDFAMNPLCKRLLEMVDGLNFKDFVAILCAFSAKSSMQQKIEIIFKVYESDCKGKMHRNGLIQAVRDLTDSSVSDAQREGVISELIDEGAAGAGAGYTKQSSPVLDHFVKLPLLKLFPHITDGIGAYPDPKNGGGSSR